MIGKISIFQSRSQLSVGSSRRRGSSIGGSSKITNEVQSYIAELGTDCLTPTLLAGWIRSKGEEFGSIYLVPYSPDGRRSCLSHETGARDSKISRGMPCLNIIFCLSGFSLILFCNYITLSYFQEVIPDRESFQHIGTQQNRRWRHRSDYDT